MKLHHEAEEIRNGLLQESFAVRRGLEVFLESQKRCGHEHSSSAVTVGYDTLQILERFHLTVKAWSDRLSPPYLDDSLPHAIGHLVEGWKTRYPTLSIHLSVPTEWPIEAYSDHRAIVLVLDELFYRSSTEFPTLSAIAIHLYHHNAMGKLSVKLTQSVSPSPEQIQSQALIHLQRVSQGLTMGHCSYRWMGSEMQWELAWNRVPTLGQNVRSKH